MRRWLTLLLLAAAPAMADSPDRPLEFAPRLVAAINGKNVDRRKELLHPKTLACITPQTQPFIEDWLADQFRYSIPASYKSRFDVIPADRPLSVADGVTFPLRPTHQVQIDWETGPQQGVTFVAMVAYTESGWREVARRNAVAELVGRGYAAGRRGAQDRCDQALPGRHERRPVDLQGGRREDHAQIEP